MDKVDVYYLILLIIGFVDCFCLIGVYNRFEKLRKDFDNHVEIKKIVYKIR